MTERTHFLPLIVLATSLMSCDIAIEDTAEYINENGPILQADIKSVIVPAEEAGAAPTDRTLMITSSMDWTAALEPEVEWLSISKNSGKAGKTLIILSFQKYDEVDEDRSTALRINGDNETFSVTVTQTRTAAYLTLLSPSEVQDIPFKPNQATVSFRTNSSWSANIEDGATAGVSLSPSSGDGDAQITVSFGENADTEAFKEATLVITAAQVEEPVTVHFIQAKAIPVILTASLEQVKVPAYMPDGSTVTGTLDISSNVSWSASVTSDWVTVHPANWSNDSFVTGNATLTLSFQDYDSLTENRTCILRIATDDGKKTLEIPVIQNKKEAFVQFTGGSTEYIGSEAGNITLEFVSTGDWTASLKNAADGISLPVTSGNKDANTLTVEFAEFMCAGQTRTATVVLTSASGITDEVTVFQKGTDLFLDFSGGNQPFTTDIAYGTMITNTQTEYTLSLNGTDYGFVFYAKGGYTLINKPEGQTCGINWTPNDKNSWIKFPGLEHMKLKTVKVYTSNMSSSANKGFLLRDDPASSTNLVQNWEIAANSVWGELTLKAPETGKCYYLVGGNKSIIFSKLHLIYEY